MIPLVVPAGSVPMLESEPESQRSIDAAISDVRLTPSAALRAPYGT
jgi:hypothetical protein